MQVSWSVIEQPDDVREPSSATNEAIGPVVPTTPTPNAPPASLLIAA